MRIGNFVIDLDEFSTEDLNLIIEKLRNARARKEIKACIKRALDVLIIEAQEQGFFISTGEGSILRKDEFKICEME